MGRWRRASVEYRGGAWWVDPTVGGGQGDTGCFAVGFVHGRTSSAVSSLRRVDRPTVPSVLDAVERATPRHDQRATSPGCERGLPEDWRNALSRTLPLSVSAREKSRCSRPRTERKGARGPLPRARHHQVRKGLAMELSQPPGTSPGAKQSEVAGLPSCRPRAPGESLGRRSDVASGNLRIDLAGGKSPFPVRPRTAAGERVACVVGTVRQIET